MKLIDSHSHLAFPVYDEDRSAALSRMREQGVGAIDIGTNVETSRAAVELATHHDFIWAAVGIHPAFANPKPYHDPNELKEAPVHRPVEENIIAIRELSANPQAVAIGECGLDYHRMENSEARVKDMQRELFQAHINLAEEKNLPLVLHCRDAHEDALEILKASPGLRGTVHFFTGTIDQARSYIELGFHIGLDGPITFTDEYDSLIKELPLEKLLVETDCPYASPVPYRGQRNEPVFVVEIAKKIAAVKKLSLEEVTEQTTRNTRELFKL